MKKLILTAFIAFMSMGMYAQPVPPPNSGGTGGGHGLNGSQPVGAPIDGGLSILIALGAAYGAKKVYRFKNKEAKD